MELFQFTGYQPVIYNLKDKGCSPRCGYDVFAHVPPSIPSLKLPAHKSKNYKELTRAS